MLRSRYWRFAKKFKNPMNDNRNAGGSLAGAEGRTHPRFRGDDCLVKINGQPYQVLNWSEGGILIEADSRLFEPQGTVSLDLMFRMREDGAETIPLKGEIVRLAPDRVALRFPAEQTRTAKLSELAALARQQA